MDLRHLRYLVAIADAGTFSGAAERLRVAQPALSRQMNALERELGVDLFEDGARRATLTSAGTAAVRLARHVIRDTERAVGRARLSNSGLAGTCELAAGPLPVLSGLVGRLVARMRAAYPGITLTVHEVFAPYQWDALANAEFDVGLGVPPPSHPSLASETQMMHNIDVALVAPHHALASEQSVGLAQLVQHPLVALAGRGSTDFVRKAFEAELRRRKLKAPAAVREVDTFESMLAHVRANHGWSFGTSLMLPRTQQVVGLPISDFRTPFPTTRIWRRADTRPVVRTVLSVLRQLEVEDREVRTASAAAAASGAIAAQPSNGVVPPRLELRHLRSFSKVARVGTLGRAAEALDITQPALSRQMRDLEYDVGVALLERGARGIELTPAGQVFLGDVNAVLSVADRLAKEVRRAQRGETLNCVVGMVPHPHVDRVLGSALARLAERHARINVRVDAIPSPKQSDALHKSEIDIAIGHIFPVPIQPGDGFMRHKLFDDAISTTLVSRDHPLASASQVAAPDLAEIPFLWGRRRFFTRFYDVVMQRLDALGLRPRIESEYDGLNTVWTLVAQGQGWTLGWESHLMEPPPGTKAVPLRDFRLPWGVELVYRQDEARDAILAVIDAIADSALLLDGASGSDGAGDTSKATIP